jgi:prophage regulatory protein
VFAHRRGHSLVLSVVNSLVAELSVVNGCDYGGPMTQHLVGVAEIAKMLGVSRQRVNQLLSTDQDFPVPEAELIAGRVWKRADVEAWIKRRRKR